jgi:hypothetical protein
MFKLAIAVPTYNRSKYLSITLDKIIKESKNYHDQVEIVISDNCSDDDTKSLIFSKNFPNITYHKQDKNIGFMKNFEYLSSLVNSEYIWYLGDDDIPTSGSIKKILNVINDNSYSMLYLNSQAYEYRNTVSKIYRQEKEDIIFNNGRDLFSFAHFGIQFISAVIVQTKYMINAIERHSNAFDKETHIIEFMDVMCQDKGYFISDIMILAGYTDNNLNRNTYSSSYFIKKTNWLDIFFIYPQNIVKYAIKNLKYEEKNLQYFKEYNDYQFIRTYSFKKKESNIIDYKFISLNQALSVIYSKNAKLKFLIVYLVPSFILNRLWKLIKKIFSK